MHFLRFFLPASSLAYIAFALPVTSSEPLVDVSESLHNVKAATKSLLSVARDLAVDPSLVLRHEFVPPASILLRKRSSKGKGSAKHSSRHQPSTKHQPKVKKQVKKNARAQRAAAKKAVKTSSPKQALKTTACKRKIGPRNLFGRADTPPCEPEDIHLTLKKYSKESPNQLGDEISGTIKGGTPNLGALSTGNHGVYKVENWGGISGTHIAKKFLDHKSMEKEAKYLKKTDQLIAQSDAQHPEPWVVMKHVPGSPLTETDRFKEAISPSTSKENCEKFLTDRHNDLANSVEAFENAHRALHGDLKDANVHWEFDQAGKATVHLLDFGNMKEGDNAKTRHMKMNGGKTNTRDYALHRANQEWNHSKCQGN